MKLRISKLSVLFFVLTFSGASLGTDLFESTIVPVKKINFFDEAKEIVNKAKASIPEIKDLKVEFREKGNIGARKITIKLTSKDQPLLHKDLVNEIAFNQVKVDGSSVTAIENLEETITQAIASKVGYDLKTGQKNAMLEQFIYLPSRLSEMSFDDLSYDVELQTVPSEGILPRLQINLVEFKKGKRSKSMPLVRQDEFNQNVFSFFISDGKTWGEAQEFTFCHGTTESYYKLNSYENKTEVQNFINYRRAYLIPHVRDVLKRNFELQLEEPSSINNQSSTVTAQEKSDEVDVPLVGINIDQENAKTEETQPGLLDGLWNLLSNK